MESPRRIKPLLKHRFYLRSIYAYKHCLIRRPKHILNLDCSHSYTAVGETKAQFKLLKALKLLKPVQKVDLSRFAVLNSQKCHTVILSALKSVSKVPAIQLEKHDTLHQTGTNAHTKGIKLLPNLRNLVYQLILLDTPEVEDQQANRMKNPLRYLKCCPKIQSLTVDVSGEYEGFLKVFQFHKYPTSLKHLFLDVLLDRHDDQNFVIPFQRFKELESVYLIFNQTLCHNFVIRNIEELSKVPNLQKLVLQFEGKIFPAIHPMLKKIAERKALKKLALTCIDHYPDEEGLQALQGFDQLTHFKISAFVTNSQELRQITQSIQNMATLEYLNIGINNRTQINAGYELQIMCQHINNFHSLRYLRLFVNDVSRGYVLPSIVPHLRQTLTKAVPLESLNISCNQLNPTQTLADLADLFQGSTASLHTLELYFGIYSPGKQAQETIIHLLQSLHNLRVFSLRGHVINSKSYFEKITNAIHQLKDLRELTFGKMEEETVNPSVLQDLLSKRGLNSFVCKVPETFIYELKSINKKNPFLELCQLSNNEDGYDRLEEMYTWDSPVWLGFPTDKPDSLSEWSQSDFFDYDLEDGE